jgi:hypothetical protein
MPNIGKSEVHATDRCDARIRCSVKKRGECCGLHEPEGRLEGGITVMLSRRFERNRLFTTLKF